jgi:hypothetical protein
VVPQVPQLKMSFLRFTHELLQHPNPGMLQLLAVQAPPLLVLLVELALVDELVLAPPVDAALVVPEAVAELVVPAPCPPDPVPFDDTFPPQLATTPASSTKARRYLIAPFYTFVLGDEEDVTGTAEGPAARASPSARPDGAGAPSDNGTGHWKKTKHR